jgi:hypothetical protein
MNSAIAPNPTPPTAGIVAASLGDRNNPPFIFPPTVNVKRDAAAAMNTSKKGRQFAHIQPILRRKTRVFRCRKPSSPD